MNYLVVIRYRAANRRTYVKNIEVEALDEPRARYLAKRAFAKQMVGRGGITILSSEANQLALDIKTPKIVREERTADGVKCFDENGTLVARIGCFGSYYEGQKLTMHRGPFRGQEVVIASVYCHNGQKRFAVEARDGAMICSREKLDELIKPVETVEFWSVYPNGYTYVSERPVTNSQYDIQTQLVQIKVTKIDGKIVKKEFV